MTALTRCATRVRACVKACVMQGTRSMGVKATRWYTPVAGQQLRTTTLLTPISQGYVSFPKAPYYHTTTSLFYMATEDLDMDHYHSVADTTLNALSDSLEMLFEDSDTVKEIFDDGPDVEFSSGVMTIRMGNDRGTYVINKQPPNKQIWLSSPISGPKRYDYDSEAKVWFYARDNSTMKDLLHTELSKFLETEVRLDFGEA